MKVDRLAEFLDCKYRLFSQATPVVSPVVLESAKKEIRIAFNNYVNPNTAKEPVIQMLADANIPYVKNLSIIMKNFVDQINTMSAEEIFHTANKIAKYVEKIAIYEISKVEIHESVRVTKESERNYRALVKKKFGVALYRLSSMLVNVALLLAKSLGINPNIVARKIDEPSSKELTKQQLIDFRIKSPLARAYGLDSEEVLSRVLAINRPLLTEFINSANRGHIPKSAPVIRKLVNAIRAELSSGKTNVSYFEQEDIPEPSSGDLFEPDEETEHFIEGDPLHVEPSLLDPMTDVRKKEQIKKEDEEAAQRKKEWENKMMSKYNNTSLYQFLRKVQP